MKFLGQLLAAMLLWILIACNNNSDKGKVEMMVKDISLKKETTKQADGKSGIISNELMTSDTTRLQQNTPPQKKSSPGKSETKEDWDKKIIKNGNLRWRLKITAVSIQRCTMILKNLEGMWHRKSKTNLIIK